MQIKLKIPKNWISVICSQRVLVNKYETNNLIKYIGIYVYLKNITNSGCIYNFNTQKRNFYTELNLSKNSFDTSINNCIKLGLCTLVDNKLVLSSYHNVSKILGIKKGNLINFTFDNQNKTKINDVINALNIKLNQSKQQKAIINRINANSFLKAELNQFLSSDNLTIEQMLNELFKMQLNFFKKGTKNSSLFAFRFDYNSTLISLKKLFNTKSTLTITYIKRKLEKLNLIFIEKLGGVIAGDNQFRARHINTNLRCSYNREINKPVWYINDRLHCNLSIN